MKWYGRLRMLPRIILPVGAILIVALGTLSWQIRNLSSSALQRTAERELAAMAGEFGNSARLFFEFALNEAEGIARALAQAKEDESAISREAALSMIRGLQKSNPDFLGAAVAWEPNAFDGRDSFYVPTGENNYASLGSGPDGRFIPYAVAGASVEPLVDLDSSDYYNLPKRRNQSSMVTPFFYEIDGKDVLMTTASAAIKVNGRFLGAVMVDLALDKVNDMLRGVKVYQSGWSALLAQDGTIVAFHDAAQIGKNILETPHVGDRDALQAAMRSGKAFMEQHDNGTSLSFYHYYPITFHSTGQTWYFVISAPLDEVLADVRHISRLTLAISGAALLLILLVLFIVVRSSVKPLGVLAGAARDISGGNLRVSIRDEAFGGELKELSSSLKDMIASLLANIDKAEAMSEDAKAQARKTEDAMREAEAAREKSEAGARAILAAANNVEAVVAQLSASTDELSAQVGQSSKGAELQRERLGSSATAMEEMNSTALEVARNAEVAADSSEKVKEKARDGESIVRQSVESIGIVQQDTLELRQIMEELGKQAESIGVVMTVISDIADQTNLLALNAAIEAARAGDAGRGFAVVADEVRKLAEKTMAATKEVGDAINGIQNGARHSIGAVGKTAQNLDSSTELVRQSGVALREILREVDSTAAQVASIATASEEQSAASDEITRSLEEINGMACEAATAMQHSAQAVSDLAQQTRKLQNLVNILREGGSSATSFTG